MTLYVHNVTEYGGGGDGEWEGCEDTAAAAVAAAVESSSFIPSSIPCRCRSFSLLFVMVGSFS